MTDLAYYRERLAQEEEAARKASCIEARICHEALASAYRRVCAGKAMAVPTGRSSERR